MNDHNSINGNSSERRIITSLLIIIGLLLMSTRAIIPYFFHVGTGNEPVFNFLEALGVFLVEAEIISFAYGRMERQSDLDRQNIILDEKAKTMEAIPPKKKNTAAAISRLEEMI